MMQSKAIVIFLYKLLSLTTANTLTTDGDVISVTPTTTTTTTSTPNIAPANIKGVHIDMWKETSLTVRIFPKSPGEVDAFFIDVYRFDNQNTLVKSITHGKDKTDLATVVAIQKLVPGTEYFLKVYSRLRNVTCSTNTSAEFNRCPAAKRTHTCVSSPSYVTTTKIDEQSVDLSWVLPFGGFDYFKVYCGTEDSVREVGKATYYTCDGLTPGTRYDMSVETVRDFYERDSKEPHTCGHRRGVVSVLTNPSSPTDVTATAHGWDTLEVCWKTKRTKLTRYLLYVSSRNGTSKTSIPRPASCYNLTGLYSTAIYNISIVSVVADGNLQATSTAASIQQQIVRTVTPTNVKVFDKDNSDCSLYITWELFARVPPINPLYQVRITNQKTKQNITFSSNDKNIMICKLDYFTNYSIELRVNTPEGPWRYSNAIYKTTKESAPGGPPLNVKVTSNRNSTMGCLYITWDPPKIPNGFIKGYRVRVHSSVKNKTVAPVERNTTSQELTICQLKLFTNYTTTVSAFTAAGGGPYSEAIVEFTNKKAEVTGYGAAAPTSHFFKYFLVTSVFILFGYLLYHNKQKIIGFVHEIKSGSSSSRPRARDGHEYKKLTNLEETLPQVLTANPHPGTTFLKQRTD